MDESQVRKNVHDLQDLSMDIIKGVPWAEEMWKVLLNGSRKAFLNWTQLALKMGKKEDDVKEWVEIYIERFEDTCCELVSDLEQLQNNLIKSIEKSLERVEELCKILQVDMPDLGNENRSLYQEQRQLNEHIEKLENEIQIRKSDLNKLAEKQMELCHTLGSNTRQITDSPLPSAEEINELKTYIEKLEQEKFDRFEKFCAMKEEIVVIVEELNFKPSTQFEKDILLSDDFVVSEDNMRKLEHFCRSLKEELKIVKEEVSELKNKITHYWNLLEIPLLEQEEFKQKYAGHSLDILETLRKEVKNYEEKKKANIKVFLDCLRDQLIEIWDRCHCTESVRSNFQFFNSDCYNEDLLELHERELKKWNSYYEEVKEILELLTDHSKSWFKLLELENSAVDPKRFKNRGCQLLKEEKERNKIMKRIPKIEGALHEKANNYEKQHGTPFRTHGKTIEEYIENLHYDKENARKQKLSAQKIQRENTMSVLTPAKSVQCLFPGASHSKFNTPSKRKLPTTPAVTSKKHKTNPSPKSTQSRKPTLPKITVTSVSLSKRLSTERKKRIDKIRRQSAQKQTHGDAQPLDSTISSDYVEFENEISTRNDIRSTMLPHTPISSKGVRVAARTILPQNGTPAASKTPTNNNLKLAVTKSDLNSMF